MQESFPVNRAMGTFLLYLLQQQGTPKEKENVKPPEPSAEGSQTDM